MGQPVFARFEAAFAQALAQVLDVPANEIQRQLKPADPAHGDVSFPAFALAKSLKKAPPAIAAQAATAKAPGMTIAAAGPYVNARFDVQPFTGEALHEIRAAGTEYGRSTAGQGKTVVIDYSSPNIAKPVAFHNVRTTIIGHSIAQLHRRAGFRVEGINYLGDWGKQFGLLAAGFEEFGDAARRTDTGHLIEVYVKANARAEKEPEFDERARAYFRRMELGDEKALALWREFRETSLADFRKVYDRLGIHFEHYEGESHYQGKMDPVLDEIAKSIGVKESQGALIVDLPYGENEPPILLKKNDGTTLYLTRDVAAAMDRYARFHFDKSLYVVATDQSLHFKQLFTVLEKMGKAWAKSCVHVNFGRVHGMSTRKGNVVLLTDVLDEAKSRALEKVRENVAAGRIVTEDPEGLAEQIGLGAIVFGDLKNRRTTDYTFDWEEVLSFEGHTGPYLQYAHARACNILKKGGGVPSSFDAALLTLPEEQALIRVLAKLPSTVEEALAQLEPSLVSRLMLEVASSFSRWYTLGNQEREKRVLIEGDDAVRGARLALTDAVRSTLASGLSLLGVPTPQTM